MKRKMMIITIAVILVLLHFCCKNVNFTYFMASLVHSESDGGRDHHIIFSEKSGFYDEKFYLSIWAPSDEIYFTLDGSEPTKDSCKYEEPLLIDDASLNKNTNSMRTDLSAYFLEDDEKYQIPDYLIDKCTILKVAYYGDDGQKSETAERTFFVNYGEKTGYQDLNIISIVAEPESLFDSSEGIYVLGDSFKEYSQKIDYEQEDEWNWEANYRNSGREWERNAHVEIFDTNRDLVLSQDVGLRIQGGVSRVYYPKSLNIYARDEYGYNRMNYDFFGTGFYPQRVTLSSGGNDYYGKIRDRIGAELTKDYGFSTMHYVPYVVFLNGEYWGFYYLTEKYDEQYVEHYYNVNKDNVMIIKQYELETGMPDDYEIYEEMRYFIEKSDMTVESNYEKACALIDMDSFMNYYAAEIYMARNGDWPEANYALWRSRELSQKMYEDGKWRWMLFDVNTSALHSKLVEHDTLAYVMEECRMFRNLSKSEIFRNEFAKKLREMRDVVFPLDQVEKKLDEYELMMSNPMENHMHRFFGENNEKFLIESREVWAFACLRGAFIETMLENNGFK